MFISPNLILDSIFDIDPSLLTKSGVRMIMFDLDSTVVERKTAKFTAMTLNWLEELSRNFIVVIVTNNKNVNYIRKVQSQTNIQIYGNAKKPNPKAVLRILKEYNVQPSEAIFIGDRPLTDILVAKNANILSALVDSIAKNTESPAIRFVRFLERLTIVK